MRAAVVGAAKPLEVEEEEAFPEALKAADDEAVVPAEAPLGVD